MKRPLTTKQSRFCEEYMVDNNATQAAIRAGYSARTAHHMVHRLLANVGIKAGIMKLRAKIRAKNEITIEYLRQEHERLKAKAEAKGDLATATRNMELVGKTIGGYSEVIEDKRDDVPKDPDARKAYYQERIELIEAGQAAEARSKLRTAVDAG